MGPLVGAGLDLLLDQPERIWNDGFAIISRGLNESFAKRKMKRRMDGSSPSNGTSLDPLLNRFRGI
ncbi:hypothetical protein K2Y11_00925 [bacterium]|nr:hypothetical protein [bacterium]